METQIVSLNTTLNKIGITEKKKFELDLLINQVIDANQVVQQQQIIFTSLVDKSQKYQSYLAIAENDRTHTLNNRNLVDQVIQNAYDLGYNSANAFSKMTLSSVQSKQVATGINKLINKLIYSVEIINKLATIVIRKKAQNPLISDDLIARINTAGTDANNAVALTLIALKSTFVTEASCYESEAAITLEYKQAVKLYSTLSGEKSIEIPPSMTPATHSIRKLLYDAYTTAQLTYDRVNTANNETTRQLNTANTNLKKAQIKLKSLESGLAAANAAALAS